MKTWATSDQVTATDLNGNFTETLNDIKSASALSYCGDGSDGDVNINSGSFSSGPITSNQLTRDAYFNNLTLSGGDLDTNGYKLFIKGILTRSGTYKIKFNGNDGGAGGNGSDYVYSGGSSNGGTAGSAGGARSDGTLSGSVAGTTGSIGGGGTSSTLPGASGSNGGTGRSKKIQES